MAQPDRHGSTCGGMRPIPTKTIWSSRSPVRKDGWPAWIRLIEDPITDKNFAWDTTAFPSGSYRIKLIASDRPSNSPDEALTRDRESLTFIVDHDPPRVRLETRSRGASIDAHR